MTLSPLVAHAPLSRDEQLSSSLGYIAETFSHFQTWVTTGALTGGEVAFVGTYFRQGERITNLHVDIVSAGVAMTLSKCGVYSAAGTQLATSADQGAAWESQGLKTVALSAVYTVPTSAFYYLAVIAIGGTKPAMPRPGSVIVGQSTALGSNPAPVGSQVGQVDLPSPAVITAGGHMVWIGTS